MCAWSIYPARNTLRSRFSNYVKQHFAHFPGAGPDRVSLFILQGIDPPIRVQGKNHWFTHVKSSLFSRARIQIRTSCSNRTINTLNARGCGFNLPSPGRSHRLRPGRPRSLYQSRELNDLAWPWHPFKVDASTATEQVQLWKHSLCWQRSRNSSKAELFPLFLVETPAQTRGDPD